MARIKYDKETLETILQLLRTVGAKEVAPIFGVSAASLLSSLRYRGYAPREMYFSRLELRTKKIRSLYEEGLSRNDIAYALGIASRTVGRALPRVNVDNTALVSNAVEMMKDGRSLREASVILKTSESSLGRAMKSRGYSPREISKKFTAERDLCIKEDTRSVEQIASTYGLSTGRVIRILNDC